MKKLLLILLSLLFCMSCLASCNGTPEGTEDDPAESTEAVTEAPTETEEVSTAPEDAAAMELVDFIVSVPADRQAVILQLTDTQIIDASQCRTPDRLGSSQKEIWGADKKDALCYDYLREIITETKPDLILLTGDIVYGEFDDNGSVFLEFVAFMESFGIPWAPVFGNHDNEIAMGVDWQCEQFINAEHCLFVQRELHGNGNYTVGIEQGGKLTRVFVMMDSNGCGNASSASLENKYLRRDSGLTTKQINWYKGVINEIVAISPDTKLSVAFHIQPDVLGDVFAKYGTDGSTPVYIDYAENRQEGDFGYIGYVHETFWDANKRAWKSFKELGVDSIFLGHEHANSASIVYEGIRVQYGMKSSCYDQVNYVDANGNITFAWVSNDTPLVGGTVMKLDAEGNIVDPYIYYCKNAGAEIDWASIFANKAQ
ncbi:MAG: metallophosphoesterase [Clostridia bacterium]|nr:metallophosphoesterase [Clostridia bacterium]